MLVILIKYKYNEKRFKHSFQDRFQLDGHINISLNIKARRQGFVGTKMV